jgi:hypothetical protein
MTKNEARAELDRVAMTKMVVDRDLPRIPVGGRANKRGRLLRGPRGSPVGIRIGH